MNYRQLVELCFLVEPVLESNMLLPISKVSVIFFLVSMCKTKADKNLGTFMRYTLAFCVKIISFKKNLHRSLIRQLQSIDCYDSSNKSIEVNIQSRSQLLRLSDLSNGSVKIDFERIPYDQVLLTFASNQSNKNAVIDQMDCWSTVNDSMILTNLMENETQTFCLMGKDATTVSPLDCLSILPRNSELDSSSDSVWLTEDDKTLAIILLVVGLILCLAFGFGIGMLIVRRQVNARNNKKQSDMSRPDLISSDWRNDKRIEDNGYPYTDSDTISMASDRGSYVAAVNPSRFDLIKIRLEKAENPVPHVSENLYGLEDMPDSKV